MRSRLAFVVNPAAGSAARGGRLGGPVDAVRRRCAAAGVACEVTFTERPGHGRELAGALADRGFSPVVAWGGDGTVNEVATALMHRDALLGIVPAGSGNGLARELGISLDPRAALDAAVDGRDRVIDMGVLAGRPFVNLAGVGLPASVADLFARRARRSSPDGSARHPTNPTGVRALLRRRLLSGRGLPGYVVATARRLLGYRSRRYTLATGKARSSGRPCSSRWLTAGSTATGRSSRRTPASTTAFSTSFGWTRSAPRGPRWGLWHLFNGTVDRHSYVHCSRVAGVTISADWPLLFHVDGEAVQGGSSLSAAVVPKALRVRVPAAAGG